jgi:nickel-dependent lactate racemase
MLESLEEPVDAVITTAAGYPLDLTYYQAIKGITAASHIVKDGGKILLLAECQEGVGGPEFAHMLKDGLSDRSFMTRIESGPVTVDQWQLEKLAMVTAKKNVLYYVPGLPAEYYPLLWGTAFTSAEDGLRTLLAGLKPGARIAVIPEGPYVLVRPAAREVAVR